MPHEVRCGRSGITPAEYAEPLLHEWACIAAISSSVATSSGKINGSSRQYITCCRVADAQATFRPAGRAPPPSASFAMTCLCSQTFMSAEPSRAPV